MLLYRTLELDPGSREAFLEKECGDDGDLKERVKRLLALEKKAAGFLEMHPAGEGDPRGHVDYSRLSPEEQAVIKSQMVVGGILQQGDICLAIINKQLVKQGETLTFSGAEKTSARRAPIAAEMSSASWSRISTSVGSFATLNG